MPFMYEDGLPKCKKPGVYKIRNLLNGKIYIGSALQIRIRLTAHRGALRENRHINAHLQHAWNKYGEAAFRFEVVTTCLRDREVTQKLEQYYLDILKPWDHSIGYNISKRATDIMGGRKHTEESKIKMSNSAKARGSNRTGKKHTEESKELIRQSKLGTKATDEAREKMRLIRTGKKMTEEQLANYEANHWAGGENADKITARIHMKLTPEQQIVFDELGKGCTSSVQRRLRKQYKENLIAAQEIITEAEFQVHTPSPDLQTKMTSYLKGQASKAAGG